MASYPPPYPPPPGAPFGYDPKQQRRYEKDQRRAQKNAYQAQRDLYRQQARAMRRGSILGPLMIVGVGVVLLLIRSGHISFERFAAEYGQWWPALLVLAGVILVLEWTFDQSRQRDGVPYVRRGVGGGVIFLLILLALAGGAMRHISRGHEWIDSMHIGPDNFAEIFGEKHDREQQLDETFAAGTSLNIVNPHGDVTIVGHSADDQIHITVNKQIYSNSDSTADEKAQQLAPRIDRSGNVLSVVMPSLDGATADLSIQMPESGQSTITANHGDVHVTGMKSAVNVSANYGDVEFNQVTGPVTTRMEHNGSSFTAHNVSGDLSLKGHADNLMITDVSGQTSMEGDFYGDTHLEHLHGAVLFKTSRTQWTLAGLEGEVDMSSDAGLTATRVVGPSFLSTRNRNITFDGIAGDLSIKNSNGTVDVSNAAPLGNIIIENNNGGVDVTLPAHGGFTIQAENHDGDIDNDFEMTTKGGDENHSLTGTVGDGRAKIVLHTNHADLGIHKANTEPTAPTAPSAPPAPPAPPAPHSKTTHHPVSTKTVEF